MMPLQSASYLAPDGSSWKVSKATFQITENLLFGENLQEIILEGVNALSFDVDGNITIAKSLIGSPSPSHPHPPGATLTDGFNAYYANDPSKGLHMGKGSLGGFGGGKGPGKVKVWVPQVQVGLPEAEVHMQVKVVLELLVLQDLDMEVVV